MKAQHVGKISGSFIDFSERTHRDELLLDWSEKEWEQELSDMRNAGITLAIPARTMRLGRTYYFSNVFETFDEHDYLSPFMRAAASVGMEVYLSGMISDYFFTAADDDFQRMMKRDVSIYETVFGELLELYGNQCRISGLYISHEADYSNLGNRVRQDAAREFFGLLYGKLKETTGLPIMSSPFFTKSASPEELGRFWDQFLDRPMFDVLALQDGVGCDRDILPEDLPDYFEQFARALSRHEIELWHDCETFSFNPGYRRSNFDRTKIWLHPAPIGRIARQYEAARPFVQRTIAWEFGHFQSRLQVGADWYDTFSRWNLS